MSFYHLPLILFFTQKLVVFTGRIRIFLLWRIYNSMITVVEFRGQTSYEELIYAH